MKNALGAAESFASIKTGFNKFKNEMDFSMTNNVRNLSPPLSGGVRTNKLQVDQLSNIRESFSSSKKDESITPDSNKSAKKKNKTRVINIKAKHRTEVDASEVPKDKCMLSEIDAILNSQINGYKHLNYDRITPGLIMNFSKGFQKIVEFIEKYETGSNSSQKNDPKPESPLYYIKWAYENFIKRIIGISDFSEIEDVLKKWLDLSSNKYFLNQDKEESNNRKVVKSYSLLIDEYKKLAEAKLQYQRETENSQKKLQFELSELGKRKTDELKKLKSMIKGLKAKISSGNSSDISYNKYNKLKQNFKMVMSENEQLNDVALKLKDQNDDLMKKKNRLNFLVFLWMKQGYPVNKIYKEEVKPIDSHRFDLLTPSKYKNSIKKLNEEMKAKLDSNKNALSESYENLPENFFEALDESDTLNKSDEHSTNRTKGLNESYDPILEGPAIMPQKPSLIPSLNFNRLDEYNKQVKLAKKKRLDEKSKQGGFGDEVDELESMLNSN